MANRISEHVLINIIRPKVRRYIIYPERI